jgi:hypothetical protein
MTVLIANITSRRVPLQGLPARGHRRENLELIRGAFPQPCGPGKKSNVPGHVNAKLRAGSARFKECFFHEV